MLNMNMKPSWKTTHPPYPYSGALSTPAYTKLRMMEMPMAIALTMLMVETWLSVRGMETKMPMSAEMSWNQTVQMAESERVLKILAPVKTWKPTLRVSMPLMLRYGSPRSGTSARGRNVHEDVVGQEHEAGEFVCKLGSKGLL